MNGVDDIDEDLIGEPLAWHEALKADDADWDGYMAWLEAHPRHRAAFDQVALLHRIVEDHADKLRELPPSISWGRPSLKIPRRWLVASAAAAALAAVAMPAIWRSPPDIAYATGSGESRRIALAGGTSVELAPASRLVARAGDPNRLELTSGEAFFEVRHDPDRILSIQAGGFAVKDIGTRFTVSLAARFVTVAVAEGSVAVSPRQGGSVRLSAGQQLTADRRSSRTRVGAVSPADVGGWRGGRLVYSDAPLEVVAADLARHTGRSVQIDPALGGRRFSGVLVVGHGAKVFRDLADLAELSYRVDGRRVRLFARPSR